MNVSDLCCLRLFPSEDQTKHNKPHSTSLFYNCFYLLIYFKTRNFTHIILLSFYFSVTVITQIFFLHKSLNKSETKSPPQALRLLQWEEGKEAFWPDVVSGSIHVSVWLEVCVFIVCVGGKLHQGVYLYVCSCMCVLSASGGMSTCPVNHRTRRAQPGLLGSGSRIVTPLISSLVSAKLSQKADPPPPARACVCLCVCRPECNISHCLQTTL